MAVVHSKIGFNLRADINFLKQINRAAKLTNHRNNKLLQCQLGVNPETLKLSSICKKVVWIQAANEMFSLVLIYFHFIHSEPVPTCI